LQQLSQKAWFEPKQQTRKWQLQARRKMQKQFSF